MTQFNILKNLKTLILPNNVSCFNKLYIDSNFIYYFKNKDSYIKISKEEENFREKILIKISEDFIISIFNKNINLFKGINRNLNIDIDFIVLLSKGTLNSFEKKYIVSYMLYSIDIKRRELTKSYNEFSSSFNYISDSNSFTDIKKIDIFRKLNTLNESKKFLNKFFSKKKKKVKYVEKIFEEINLQKVPTNKYTKYNKKK